MPESEDTLKREVRQPVTPAVIEQTNRALEEAGGSATVAAKILDVPPSRIHNIINHTPALKARWGQSKEVTVVDVVDRPSLPEVISPAQQMGLSLAGQEKKLSRGLAKIGFSPSEVTAISEVEDFAGAHFSESLKILHGGMVKSTIRLMLLADHIHREYLTDSDLDPKELDRWWGRYFQIQEHLRDSNDAANRAALTQAMVKLKQNEAKAGRGPGKPGFGPQVAIQINPASK